MLKVTLKDGQAENDTAGWTRRRENR